MKTSRIKKGLLLLSTVLVGVSLAKASTDYPPALWVSAAKNHWYTKGNGHRFAVCHDMEGYYLSAISYFQQSGTQASAHYMVNGLKDNSSDHPAGEITQMVREAYYAWHALCWNTYSFGTEHEGFVSNPAWFTYEMYTATADLHRHLCDVWGIPKDRNHIVGHDEKKNAAWVSWASANLGIDPTCNTHTDPGAYWDWTYLMALINNAPVNRGEMLAITAPGQVAPGATFTASVTVRNTGTTTWSSPAYALGSQNPQDNTRWGMSRVSLPVSIAPGQTNTISFTCTAPTSPAIYPFEWKMVQENVQWFGQTAISSINVGDAQPVADIIIDNPAATYTGTWSTGTSSTDKYGADYRYRSQGGGSYAQFTPSIQVAGNYNVYEWHPVGSNRTTAAPYTINYNGGSITVPVNQQVAGGRWNLVGTYNFAAGTVGNVQIKDNFPDAGMVVMADAIKFVYVP